MNNIDLRQGDCVSLLDDIPDESVDLVFTSPPYYNAREYSQYENYLKYLDFIRIFVEKIYRVLNKDGFFVLNTSPVIVPRNKRSEESSRFPIPFDTFSICQNVGFKYIDDIIWEKPDGASSRGRKFSQNRRPCAYKPFTVTEYLFVMRRTDAPLIDFGIRKHSTEIIQESLVEDGYERTNVWKISPSRNKNHPATFPDSLAEKVIGYYSYVGDTVLDPFLGSGTTGVSAKKLKRNFIGFEKDERYFKIAKENINE